MKPFLALITLIPTMALLRAQTQPDQSQDQWPPQGPLLNRAPDSSQWTITIQPPPPSKPAAADAEGEPGGPPKVEPIKPRIITVIKSGHLLFEKTVTEDGVEIDSWHTPQWIVTNPGGHGWLISPIGGSSFNSPDYSKADFAGLDWISLKNFTGFQGVMGHHCFTFKDRIITADPADIANMKAVKAREVKPADRVVKMDDFKVDVEADIDVKTRLPVQLIYGIGRGVMRRTYIFKSSDGSLSLPPEIQDLLQRYQKYQARLKVPIAPI